MSFPATDLERAWLTPRADAPARIALGAMNFGKRTSAAESERIIARALERGVALVDTANVYNEGESEKIVGRAIAGRRGSVLIATKVGLGRVQGKPEGLSRAAITRAIDASLARLGVDHVDVYYLHAPDPTTPIEETLDAIAELVRAGRVRHLGVSNFASWQILEIARLCDERGIGRPRVSQVMYNLLVRQVELEYLRFAAKYSVHTTVYNPLAGGILSGKYERGQAVVENSRFDKNKMYQRRYWNDRMFALVDEYRALAAEAGTSLLDLAYAWLAGAPGVDSILVGPATVAQLDAALDAREKPLSDEIRAKAQRIHEAWMGTDASYAR